MRVSSRAKKGQDTRVKLEDEQAEQQAKITRTPRRAPVRQPVGNNQPMAAIVRSPRRVLNLDLPDAPPSDNIKFSSDWGEYNNEFWVKYFYTPNDNTTQEYMEATDKLRDFLPANFELIRGQKEAFGVANLDLKPE
jgi:hypothetical protein